MATGPDVDSFVTVNGIKLHYTIRNAQGNDTTLLVHGMNRELHVWDSVAEKLAESRRVVSVDLRGHGRSDWAKDGYAAESFAADLVGLLAALEIDEVQYVGHSLGSRVGIVFAATWQGRLRQVLLSECGPDMPQAQADWLLNFSRNRVSVFDNEDEALTYMRSINPDWKEEFHQTALVHEFRTNWVGKVVRRSDPELHWLFETEIVNGNPYLWECWSRITAPITVLWATGSDFFDDKIIGRMQLEQPTMTLCRPQGSHYFLRQSPQEFLRYAEAVLAPTAGALVSEP